MLQVTCWRRVGGWGVTVPRERQTSSQAEKGFCCFSVTEAFGVCNVCCPTFGMPAHMKNAQVAGVATKAGEEDG